MVLNMKDLRDPGASPPISRLALSTAEAAAAYGVSRAWLYPYVSSGQLPSIKLAGRRLIRVEALELFLRDREQGRDNGAATGSTPAAARGDQVRNGHRSRL